jgi:two-component system OmpR family response regulator
MNLSGTVDRADIRVLVVDDEPAIARQMQSLIAEWGYSARVSSDGREVRRLVTEWTPDLALIDLGLAACDGLGLLRDCERKTSRAWP